jgi:hypothetical protein
VVIDSVSEMTAYLVLSVLFYQLSYQIIELLNHYKNTGVLQIGNV